MTTGSKTITKLVVIVSTFIALVVGYLVWWYYHGNGIVLIRSESPYSSRGEFIIVRKHPASPPLWALWVDHATSTASHRCEFYLARGARAHWSAQTYSGDSLSAGYAEVRWEESGGAAVSIGGPRPVLEMHGLGFWRRVE